MKEVGQKKAEVDVSHNPFGAPGTGQTVVAKKSFEFSINVKSTNLTSIFSPSPSVCEPRVTPFKSKKRNVPKLAQLCECEGLSMRTSFGA